MVIKDQHKICDRPTVNRILDNNIDLSHISNKGIIGLGTILMNGNKLDVFQNLVTLHGREFIASKMTGVSAGAKDWTDYKIGYFRVGSGGSDVANPNTRFGPYDNDMDLIDKIKISDTEINTDLNGYLYMGDGYDKKLEDVSIVLEQHHIHTADEDIFVDNYTSIKNTLIIRDFEPTVSPFSFNEAALVAYKYDSSGNPIDGTGEVIARFTTSTKQLDSDELTIEWFILV